jgi:hypothetical protein
METAQTSNIPSIETIWAILQEVVENQKETAFKLEETCRLIKETYHQTEYTDLMMKENRKIFDDLSSYFGKVVDYMIAPTLREKFIELGFNFEQTGSNVRVSDHKNNIHFGIDYNLRNSNKEMLIKLGTDMTTEDIKDHIARLEKMRKYANLHGDKRSFLGAVAGVVIADNVKDYALNQGFFVIEPSGESFNITQPKNKPKEW